jgi:hypothetical protein
MTKVWDHSTQKGSTLLLLLEQTSESLLHRETLFLGGTMTIDKASLREHILRQKWYAFFDAYSRMIEAPPGTHKWIVPVTSWARDVNPLNLNNPYETEEIILSPQTTPQGPIRAGYGAASNCFVYWVPDTAT